MGLSESAEATDAGNSPVILKNTDIQLAGGAETKIYFGKEDSYGSGSSGKSLLRSKTKK